MVSTIEIVKKDIRLLSKAQLEEALLGFGEKKFRANQIYEWLWQRSATDFDEMLNLSKDLRLKLKDYFPTCSTSSEAGNLRLSRDNGAVASG